MSTTEIEYTAIGEAAKETSWFMGLVEDLGLNQSGVQFHCDSQSVIDLTKHWVYPVMRFYKIRELTATEEIFLENVYTLENAVMC